MRNFLLFSTIFLLLAVLGTFAWVSHNPDSPHLEKAQEWPVVGELARMVREGYLGPPQPDPSQTAELATSEDAEEENIILDLRGIQGNPDKDIVVYKDPKDLTEQEQRTVDALVKRSEERFGKPPPSPAYSPQRVGPKLPVLAVEWRWFLPGQPLLTESWTDSETQDRLVSMAYLPVLSRDGNWMKVRYDGRDGWIDTGWEPEHSRRGARRGILRERANPVARTDWSDLDVGKEMLGVKKPQRELADWALYTDVEDEDLLALLAGAAEKVEDAFFSRYGRIPSQAPTHAVLLFAKHSDYRRFSDETAELPSPGHRGHASQGLVAMSAEESSRREVASILVHELTHLLVRRALGSKMPPWLNEGMATDMGSVWVEDSRDLVLDQLVDDQEFSFGPFSMRVMYLDQLARGGKLEPLSTVLGRDRGVFYRSSEICGSYAQSVAFVRYMLDAEGDQLEPGFLAFLDDVAKGRRADLLQHLGRGVPELDAGFRAWLAAEVELTRKPLSAHQRGPVYPDEPIRLIQRSHLLKPGDG